MNNNRVGRGVDHRGDYMCLSDGRVFHPLSPYADEVFIEDIAKALARQIRYNGLSDHPVSVAQHSCNCAWIADRMGYTLDTQLAMVMHDSAETYIGDMIAPIKIYIPAFKKIEAAIGRVIDERFKLPNIQHKTQKLFDNLALGWEKRDMFASANEWSNMPELPDWLPPMKEWDFDYAEHRFIIHFNWLMIKTDRGKLLSWKKQ